MTDPRWPNRRTQFRQSQPPTDTAERLADKYENEVFSRAGTGRNLWFYEYPETTRFVLDSQIKSQLGEPVTNPPKKQGTSFETKEVQKYLAYGVQATRLAEGGMHDIGDVLVGVSDPSWAIDAVLAWKRLVKGDGSRRVPDGERVVYVIGEDLMTDLAIHLASQGQGLVIECKATERLNVTRTLGKARAKLAAYLNRKENA